MCAYALDNMACAAAREGQKEVCLVRCQTPDNTKPATSVIWVTVPPGSGW
jgi:hypothetical protein